MEWIVFAVICDRNLTDNNDPDQDSDWLQEPDIQSYESIFAEILMINTFPTDLMNQTLNNGPIQQHDAKCNLASGVILKQIQCICNNLSAFGIPRTLYELIFLREYLYGRVSTAFKIMDDDLSFLEEYGLSFAVSSWIFDHKTFAGPITYQTLCDKVLKRININDNPRLAFTYYEMNNLILKYVTHTAQKLHISSQEVVLPDGILCPTVLQAIFDNVMNDLIDIQHGQHSDISRSYDVWPLRSESLMDTLVSSFSDARSTWQPCYEIILQHAKSLQKDISTICKVIKAANQSPSLGNTLAQFQSTVTEFCGKYSHPDDNKEHDVACTIAAELWSAALDLCYEATTHIGNYLSSASYGTTKVMEILKKLKRYLDPIYAVDPCVYCFRKPGFVSKRPWSAHINTSSVDTIWNCILMEISAHKNGHFLLYRGTADPDHDSMFIQTGSKSIAANPALVHSLSFGMSLFSGILFDKTATVFNKMRKMSMRGYAVQLPMRSFLVPKDNKALGPSDVVFIPPLPTLLQLAGLGELFHPRTKLWIPSEWQESRQYFVSGIFHMCYKQVPDFLRISGHEGSQQDVMAAFNQLKSQLVLIK